MYPRFPTPFIISGIQGILRALFKRLMFVNLSPPFDISCSNCESIILGLFLFQIKVLKSLVSLSKISILVR